MSKKLESRSDLLSCWVEKGAKIDGNVVKTFTEEGMGNQNTTYLINKEYEGTGDSRDEYHSIREILYSPESNFFDVMFPINGVGPLVGKTSCVLAHDPLTYLLDTLNETTS